MPTCRMSSSLSYHRCAAPLFLRLSASLYASLLLKHLIFLCLTVSLSRRPVVSEGSLSDCMSLLALPPYLLPALSISTSRPVSPCFFLAVHLSSSLPFSIHLHISFILFIFLHFLLVSLGTYPSTVTPLFISRLSLYAFFSSQLCPPCLIFNLSPFPLFLALSFLNRLLACLSTSLLSCLWVSLFFCLLALSSLLRSQINIHAHHLFITHIYQHPPERKSAASLWWQR